MAVIADSGKDVTTSDRDDSAEAATAARARVEERSPKATIDVVVMASGINEIPLYEGYRPGYKALIPYRGRTSIQYVMDALAAVDEIGDICIVGPRDILAKELADRMDARPLTLVEGGETFLESLAIGLKHFHASRAVLFITADAPLIRPEAIRQFLAACATGAAPTGYDQNLYVSVAPKTSYTGPYAQFTKPFNHFRDVAVCHGNLFLMSPDLLDREELRERVNRMYTRRKSVRSVVEAFGWRVALTYAIGAELLRLVTLRQMAAIASRRIGVGIVPVVVPDPDITMDADEADDYEFIQARLDERAEAEAGARSAASAGANRRAA